MLRLFLGSVDVAAEQRVSVRRRGPRLLTLKFGEGGPHCRHHCEALQGKQRL